MIKIQNKIRILLGTTALVSCIGMSQASYAAGNDYYNNPAVNNQYRYQNMNEAGPLASPPQGNLVPSFVPCCKPMSGSQKVNIKSVEVRGAESLPPQTIENLVQPLVGTVSSIDRMNEIATKIVEHYQAQGILLATAYIPEQSFQDGIIRIQVMEGMVRDIVVEGEDVQSEVIKGYMDKILTLSPVYKNELLRYILLMNTVPGYQVEYELKYLPASEVNLGDRKVADLILLFKRSHGKFNIDTDSYGTSDLGKYNISAGGELLNMFNKDETIFGFVGTTNKPKRMKVATVGLIKALNSESTSLEVMGSYNVNDSNQVPGVSSKDDHGNLIETKISHYPFLNDTSSVKIDGGLKNRHQKSYNGSSPQAHYHILSAQLGAVIQHEDSFKGFNSFAPRIYQAIKGMSKVTMNDTSLTKYSNDYTLFAANIERDQALISDTSLYLSVNGQYTGKKNLPPEEQFAIGGMFNGRAYKTAIVSANRGLGGLVEFRYTKSDLGKLLDKVQPYAFYDVVSFPKKQALTNVSSLSSCGIGTRFTFAKDVNLTLEVAVPLRKHITINDVRNKNSTKYSVILNKSFNW